jgi:hypothetical protein
VAGDGYFYTTYGLRVSHLVEEFTETKYVHVLRIGSNGSYNDMPMLEWTAEFEEVAGTPGPSLITNGDTGAVLTWQAEPQSYEATMALVGAGGLSLMRAPDVSTDGTPVAPVLQAQDGWFVGSVSGDDGQRMVAFDQSGGVRWVVAGYTPRIALADGGVVATDESGMAVAFGQNGGATGAVGNLAARSWTGNWYQTARWSR